MTTPIALLATCAGGHRVTVVPSGIGTPCWVCGCPLREPDAIDQRIARYEAARVARLAAETETTTTTTTKEEAA